MASSRRRRHRPRLFILRGLPATGKTDLAWDIMERYDYTGVVLSTDDYFIDEDGRYYFQYRLLREAHEWNQNRAEEAMQAGVRPVIIDNTNMRCCDMKPYVQMGYDYGYYIEFETTTDTFDCSVNELYKRNKRRIPKWVLQRMKNGYEIVTHIRDVLDDPY